MTARIASPDAGGYGWSMNDSARLRAEVARRAGLDAARAATPRLVGQDATNLVLDMARRHVKDPSKIRPATDEEWAEAEAQPGRERRARQAEIMLGRLPARYRAFEIPTTEAGVIAKRWVLNYTRGNRDSLVILGPPGTGKTGLACAMLRELLVSHTVPATIVTVAEFLDALRPSARTPGLDVDMIQFKTTPILCLDDLGPEILTEWGAEQLYRLAHHRSHHGLPIIVTSNLSGRDIRARYDQRLVERLFGGATLITLAGETRRPMPF